MEVCSFVIYTFVLIQDIIHIVIEVESHIFILSKFVPSAYTLIQIRLEASIVYHLIHKDFLILH